MVKPILMMMLLLVVEAPSHKRAAKEAASFSWAQQSIDLGEVKLGSKHLVEFAFTNSSSTPLLISSATASCGCTVASVSNEPILPGESGQVKAEFTAKSTGRFRKTITLLANTESGSEMLTITGTVGD
jgi:hypothetical protein